MAAYDCAIQIRRNDPEAAYLGVNFSYQELALAADLLGLGLDLGSRYFVSEHDSSGVKLDSAPLVPQRVVNLDELFAAGQHVPQGS